MTDISDDILDEVERALAFTQSIMKGPDYILREHQAIASLGSGIIPMIDEALTALRKERRK